VRLSLVHHGKGNSWIKPVSNDIEASLLSVYGGLLYNMVERHTLTQEEGESPLTLDMIIPKNISGIPLLMI
jgi:hypothetical protein